jgi:hypothetical protein
MMYWCPNGIEWEFPMQNLDAWEMPLYHGCMFPLYTMVSSNAGI